MAITGIMGIGREKTYSLCGELGSRFMIDEWEYPAIDVAICDCPSAAMVCEEAYYYKVGSVTGGR